MRRRSTTIAATAGLGWLCAASVLAQPGAIPEPISFGCEVRYHFRESLGSGRSGEKKFSAPSFEREALPGSRLIKMDGSTSRVVEGRVRHLPYLFVVKIKRTTATGPATLEVNVLDKSDQSVAGFPRVLPNPIAADGDTTRKAFRLPIDSALKKKIENNVLAENQFLTRVDLIVGADDEFLSSPSR